MTKVVMFAIWVATQTLGVSYFSPAPGLAASVTQRTCAHHTGLTSAKYSTILLMSGLLFLGIAI
jgi:hypothetical protein